MLPLSMFPGWDLFPCHRIIWDTKAMLQVLIQMAGDQSPSECDRPCRVQLDRLKRLNYKLLDVLDPFVARFFVNEPAAKYVALTNSIVGFTRRVRGTGEQYAVA